MNLKVDSTDHWDDRWTGFLRSEREGARSTTSKLVAFLVGLLGTFLALLLTFRQQGVDFQLGSVAIFIYVWAISVAAIATDAWAQYLGALKSISRRRVDPRQEPLGAKSDESTVAGEFDELAVRDPGVLAKIALKALEEDRLPGMESESVRRRARGFRSAFWRALLASAAGFVVAPAYLTLPIPAWFPLILF